MRSSRISAQSKSTGKGFSLRFLFVFITVAAAGLGLWKALSYRHPAHANPLYEKADFTSSRSITVGANVVSIRSIARNRYDGSIDVLQGPGLSTSIPHADVLKKCCMWLDVVQVELVPGPQRLEIQNVRVFHHDSRQLFDESERLGWRLFSLNVVHIYGIGTKVPQQFDLWFQARSYSTEEVAILEPKVGSEVELAGGTIKVTGLKSDYVGWTSEEGFLQSDEEYPFSHGAVELEWKGSAPGDQWYDFDTFAGEGVTDFGFNDINLRFPRNKGTFPQTFGFPLDAVTQFKIRPHVRQKSFFFDGLNTLPLMKRTFDPPPTVTRTIDQVVAGTQLTEFAPLDISARIYGGVDVRPEYHAFLNTASDYANAPINSEGSFTLVVQEIGALYVPVDFYWKRPSSGQWQSNGLASGNANEAFHQHGMCKYRVYEESIEDFEAVKFTPR